ncbi:MAG: hypothetical protein J7L19_03225 [Dehalococcoidia bacterium]|nr:hypothetical protein [Dehalococcoidia bacterium]
MIKILDLEATLRGFAHQLRANYSDSGIEGRRSIAPGVDGTDQEIEIQFEPEKVTLGKASHLSKALMLSEHEMVRFIFGPSSPSIIPSLPQNARFLDALLPVDFYLWPNETV